MTDETNPLLDAAIRAGCGMYDSQTPCIWPECHKPAVIELIGIVSGECPQATMVLRTLRAFFDAAERSPEVVEAMRQATPALSRTYDIHTKDVLRALRAQALGEER